MIEITIKGGDALRRALGDMQKRIDAYAQAALGEIAQEILDTPGLQRYPPASEANAPGRFSVKTRKPMGYYTRGRGAWYPIMRKPTLTGLAERSSDAARRQGLTGAGRSFGVAGYKLRPTSETLGKKWYVKRRGAGEIVVGNSASYARYVNGREQARIMDKRGWTRLEEAAAAKLGEAQQIMDRWMDKLVSDSNL